MKRRATLLALLIVLSPRLVGAVVFDPARQWQTLVTPHFAIHHMKDHAAIAERVGGYAETAWVRLTAKLDNRPWGKIHLVLVDQNETANGFATVIPYNVIVLRVVSPDPDSGLANYDDWLKTLVTHELTHIVHLSTTGYPAQALQFLFGKLIALNGLEPGWITEGLATYEETVETTQGRGRSSITDMLLRTDILNHQFLPIDKAAGTYPGWPGWRAQYLYGVEFMKFLAGRYGEDSLTRFSHSYGSSLWFYSLNHHAKKVFGKPFTVLWQEWEDELQKKYGAVKSDIDKQGRVEPQSLLANKDILSAPTPLPDGSGFLYIQESIHRPPAIYRTNLNGSTSELLLKGYAPQQISVDPSGDKIAFSALQKYHRYYSFSDIFSYEFKTKLLRRLTVGARASDPDISPDGKSLALVQVDQGTANLFVRLIDGSAPHAVTHYTQFEVVSHPRWSPDGKKIAAAVWREGEGRDLYLFDPDGKRPPQRLTNDRRQLMHPWWSADGHFIYVSSDRTGIYNIWKVEAATGRMEQMTNVLSGVFYPTLLPDQTRLTMQYYNGRGYEVRALSMPGVGGRYDASRGRASTGSARSVLVPFALSLSKGASEASTRVPNMNSSAGEVSPRPLRESTPPPLADTKYFIRPYHPGTTLLPRFMQPMAFIFDNTVLLSANIGSTDPLLRHGWSANGTYRSDNNFVGAGAAYAYTRYPASPFIGFQRYAAKFGRRFSFSTSGEDFFEERHRGYAGLSVPVHRMVFSTSYFFEDRQVLSGVQPALINTVSGPPVGNFSGLNFSLGRTATRGYPTSITPEAGYSAHVNFEVTDARLGGDEDLEQRIAWTDVRYFLPLPADHHVLAFRLAGGAAFGDRLLQGNFVVGGSLGEGLLSGVPARTFSLRGLPFGTFSKDRAFIFSTEYRLPLFRTDRGLSTYPIFLNSGGLAFFVDVGNAWNFYPTLSEIADKTLVSVGTELRGEFTISYAVPIRTRLGYGILVNARERLGTLADDVLGTPARYGTLVLQIGTSF